MGAQVPAIHEERAAQTESGPRTQASRLFSEWTQRLVLQSPWWLISAAFHVSAVTLAALITWSMPEAPAPDEFITTTDLEAPAARPEDVGKTKAESHNALASSHDTPPTDPTSTVASDIVVPPDILAKAELGDHWETVNPDRSDTHSAFGNPEAHLFDSPSVSDRAAGGGGIGGRSLEDVIGVGVAGSRGMGGGWGGGNGTGIGVDNGSGRGSFGQHNGGGRRLMVLRHGGSRAAEGLLRAQAARLGATRETEAGVRDALQWLAAHQTAEGRWDCASYGGRSNDTAVTGLSLLAFLSAGHTEGAGAHREVVRRAVEWLRRQQEADGRVGARDAGRGYAHPIAGLSLAEAAGRAKVAQTVQSAQRALEWSCREQRPPFAAAGAWRYGGGQPEGDLSVSGWYLLQLRAARNAGLAVPGECWTRASSFLDSVSVKLGDGPQGPVVSYAYKPGSHTNARLNAIGNTCRQLLGVEPPCLEESVRHFIHAGGLPQADQADLYYWYYGTLCAFRQGGETWRVWNEALKRTLLRTQQRAGALGGSWNPQGPYSGDWGRVGQTALGALCLEIYYRFRSLKDTAPKAPQGGPQLAAAAKPDAGTEIPGTESYEPVIEKGFTAVDGEDALSTFAADVDTASYSNVRRFLDGGRRPPKAAVRIEELLNYFGYSYAPPKEGDFAVHSEVAACPWNAAHRLALVALKGREVAWENRPPCNLVFLVDVSGSMSDENKLPLVRKSLSKLAKRLDDKDRVAIAVYAGASGLALPSTPCGRKADVLAALDRLQSGGSTNGGAGIQLAYQVAAENFIKDGVNRVVLCTDGDFNVGTTGKDELLALIKEKAKTGVFLTVLGFGMGNYKDDTLELLADKGNGNYGYIDTEREADRLLVNQAGTLVTIAKDVKIQVEFNPARVAGYRLVGYENRLMAARDFRDDKKDAGEIGAGHAVTALYELIPAANPNAAAGPSDDEAPGEGDELFTVRLRHKLPEADRATERFVAVADRAGAWTDAGPNFRWAAAVAMFGMLLRGSENKGATNWDLIHRAALPAAQDNDPYGYRAEFIRLLATARKLLGENVPPPPPGNDDEF
jgi:Ca-activated chloride channel family protein